MVNNYSQINVVKSYKKLFNLLFIALFLCLFSSYEIKAQTTETLTTGSGTWYVPCGVSSITIEAWGGGGGGGGSSLNGFGGSGGGSGAYTSKTLAVTQFQAIAYSVGTGGTAGTSGGAKGGNGTASTISGMTAGGGIGGSRNAGLIGTGGIATGGTVNTNGNNGFLGGASGGNGGSAPNGGVGGNGVPDGNGQAGSSPGGGGGGGERTGGGSSGGAGGAGQIKITYTSTCPTYCVPIGVNNTYPISNVTFAGINNSTSATVTAGPDYEDFSYLAANVIAGNTYNISVTSTGLSPNLFYQYAFFDWNNNGDFTDDGAYTIGTYTTNTATNNLNIQIPITAYVGTIRMRVGNSFNAIYDPCITAGGNFQFEDYSVTISPPPACTSPTAQPTGLILTAGTPSGTSINGSFTAASPAPQSYLVVMNTTGTAPTGLITNGTTYTIGSSIGVGNTVVDTDTNTTFTASGLNTTTTYYFFIYSMNNLCTGGPLYNTNPTVLTGNFTTTGTLPTYCTPVTVTPNNSSRYINRVAFIGTLVETNNTSTFSNATPGYQDFTGLASKAVQAQGEGVNMIVESTGGRAKLYAWVDWNKDGVFSNSEKVYGPPTAGISSTFGFVIPSGTVPGDYKIRVRTFNSFYGFPSATEYFGYDFNACETFNTGTYSGNTTTQYGEAEDYVFTVIQRCDANIISTTDGQVCNSGTVTLGATGTAGVTGFKWYANATGGAALATTATGTWTTPSISTTTTYYVTAINGTCESLVRTAVVANVNPIPTLTFTPSNPEVCGENSIVALTAGGDKQMTNLLFENFEGGGLGSFTNVNNDANGATIDNDSKWTNRTSTFIPIGIAWKPAIASGLSPNKFAVATSDTRTIPTNTIENSLVSGTLNSTGYLNLTMTLKFYYSRYFPDGDTTNEEYVRIQISTNGGTTWTTLQEFLADTGIGTKFVNLTYNLDAYINQTNLKVRILHRSYAGATGWLPDGVAVDDIKIFGEVPLNTAFDWSGVSLPDAYTDAACTTPYTTGTPVVTVYVKPTLAQLASGSYTFTATALLSNGCNVSQDITITNKTKLFVGPTNDWNTASNWSPAGVPTANDCVVVTDNQSAIISPAGYQAFAKNTTVKGLGSLNITPLTYLTNTEWVNIVSGGVFHIQNSGSLIQINNVANTGNITMDRDAVTNSYLDYVYWSTPVAGFIVNNITPSATKRYFWEPSVNNGGTYAGNFGNWLTASGAMTTGKGYIIRGSSGISTFSGNPNNGNITTPITRGTYVGANYTGPTATPVTQDDDNLNLLGNPYPSAISADAFLAANSANLAQWVKVWTHGIDPAAIADPFYQDFALNYSVADYITFNAMGGTQSGYDGYIGAGQGFFVLMNDAATTSENAIFNNSMRSNTYRNDQFYKTSSSGIIEKHRIWMKLISPTGASSDALVGYASDASNTYDDKYDAKGGDVKSTFEVYSVINGKDFAIQGRALPFDENDTVPLGMVIPQSGIYTFALSKVDGLFETGQAIYLEDLQLGIIHDIKSAPYTFTSNNGRFDNRFVLRYTTNALNENTFENNQNIFVYTNDYINIKSNKLNIIDVTIFDLVGRKLFVKKNINENSILINEVNKTQSGLIINITLENGETKTIKTIF